MSNNSMESLLNLFQSLNLSSTKTVAHAPSPDCPAHTEALKSTTEFKNLSNFVQAKNLFYKVPSKGGPLKDRLFLVCADINTEIDIKKLSIRLGVKANSPLRLAGEEVFDTVLSIPRGSVNPFVMGNKSAESVYLLLDKKFKRFKDGLLFHPMRNDYTTSISCHDLQKFLEATCGKAKFQFIDLEGTVDDQISLDLEPEQSKGGSPERKVVAEQKFKPAERKAQLFADDHLFTIKKAEDTMFKTAFMKYEWVKV